MVIDQNQHLYIGATSLLAQEVSRQKARLRIRGVLIVVRFVFALKKKNIKQYAANDGGRGSLRVMQMLHGTNSALPGASRSSGQGVQAESSLSPSVRLAVHGMGPGRCAA